MRTWRVARPWVADAPDRAAGDINTPVTFSLRRNFGATRRPGAVQPASSVPVWVSAIGLAMRRCQLARLDAKLPMACSFYAWLSGYTWLVGCTRDHVRGSRRFS